MNSELFEQPHDVPMFYSLEEYNEQNALQITVGELALTDNIILGEN